MKNLMKQNKRYKFMSYTKVLFKTSHFKLDVREFYTPHYLDFNLWVRRRHEISFTCVYWFKLPLDRYARVLHKCCKYEEKFKKYKKELDVYAELEHARKLASSYRKEE